MTMTPRARATSTDGTRPAASGRGRRLDPDRLAALEEERDHLARSLRDLETERDAGDLAEEDYLALRDDYVVRTAAVLRALEEQRELRNSGPRAPLARRLLVGGGVVVFALGAGLLVAPPRRHPNQQRGADRRCPGLGARRAGGLSRAGRRRSGRRRPATPAAVRTSCSTR
ncbi:MAG: hypothetical protein R2749_20390 [Acidimicrobiales bacterium]